MIYPIAGLLTIESIIIGFILCVIGWFAYLRRPGRKYLYPDKKWIQIKKNKFPAHVVPNNEILVHTYDISSYATAFEEGNRDYGCELYYEDHYGDKVIIMDFQSRKETTFQEAKKVAKIISSKLSDLSKLKPRMARNLVP